MLNAKKGLTLIELIIAVSLVGMIILAIVAVDMASRRFVNTSDYEARAQNQIGPVLEMITKDVSRAVGNARFDTGVNQTLATNIGARLDINSVTGNPNDTPGNYSDDTWISYGFFAPPNSSIRRRTCTSWPCAASGTDPLIANYIVTPTSFTIAADGSARIVISAQLPESDNTTVTMETSVLPRGNSAN